MSTCQKGGITRIKDLNKSRYKKAIKKPGQAGFIMNIAVIETKAAIYFKAKEKVSSVATPSTNLSITSYVFR
jgi:hypothetical protein